MEVFEQASETRSRIYDQIGIPKLRYRLEICPTDDEITNELFLPSTLTLHAHILVRTPRHAGELSRQYPLAKVRQGKPVSMPYFDNEMDYVVCTCLHTFKNPVDVVKESLRVLKPGGFMVLYNLPKDFNAEQAVTQAGGAVKLRGPIQKGSELEWALIES